MLRSNSKSLGNNVVSPEKKKKKGCSGKDLQKRKVLSLEWNREWVMKNCVCESSFDVEVVCTRHHNADWFNCSSVMSTVQAGLRRPLRLALLPLLHCRFRQQGLSRIFFLALAHTHTHTHTFNGPFSGTTRVSRYQKGKTNLDFTEARDSEWQWHQLGHMQVRTSLQIDNDTIRYDTRCYFNVRSKADISQLNLPHGTDN